LELAELADKYAALLHLRTARDRGDTPPAAEALRALSVRFPGCLRELDTLGAREIMRREKAARVAAAGGPLEPWMCWIHVFHGLMAATLRVKGAASAHKLRPGNTPSAPPAPGSRATSEILELLARLGHADPSAFLATVAAPPRGRLVPLVIDALATAFGVDRDVLEDALFPRRRRPKAEPPAD